MTVIWHDVECGGYAADLGLWEELADDVGSPILDLGCGTGRVSLHLARRGHRMVGLDADPAFVTAFDERAEELPADARVGDARDFEVEGAFGLVLAPMQLVQLFADAGERVDCLRCVAAHLRPRGKAAFAIVEEAVAAASEQAPPPLPDAREIGGWVYSSLPLDAGLDAGTIAVRRLRQTVSPEGGLRDEVSELRLRMLSAGALEGEAEEAGLRPIGRRAIPATDAHVGSTAVLLGKES